MTAGAAGMSGSGWKNVTVHVLCVRLLPCGQGVNSNKKRLRGESCDSRRCRYVGLDEKHV